MVDVPDVELDPVLPRDAGPPIDLGPPREPRLDLQPPTLPRRVQLDLRGERGARADDRHLPTDHVEQVRQLVEREPAQDATDAGDAWIAGEHRRAHSDRIAAGAHRPQLEELELGAVAAGAGLAIEHRPARAELDRDRGGEQHRRRDHQPYGGEQKIEGARHQRLGPGRPGIATTGSPPPSPTWPGPDGAGS